jgi:hypothetical protein
VRVGVNESGNDAMVGRVDRLLALEGLCGDDGDLSVLDAHVGTVKARLGVHHTPVVDNDIVLGSCNDTNDNKRKRGSSLVSCKSVEVGVRIHPNLLENDSSAAPRPTFVYDTAASMWMRKGVVLVISRALHVPAMMIIPFLFLCCDAYDFMM